MRHAILPASGEKFYDPENFPKFLESLFLERAELLCRELSIKDNENEGTARIYHIMPQNITLVYSSIKRAKYNDITIYFAGEKEKVDQLVKIIHDAEKKSEIMKLEEIIKEIRGKINSEVNNSLK